MLNEAAPATQAELEQLALMTHDEIVAVRGEMKQELVAVRSEMKHEFAAVRQEMAEGFADVRTEMRNGFDRMDARFDEAMKVLRSEIESNRRQDGEIADLQLGMADVKRALKAKAT